MDGIWLGQNERQRVDCLHGRFRFQKFGKSRGFRNNLTRQPAGCYIGRANRAALTSTRGRARPHAMARTSGSACRKSGRTVTADSRQRRAAAKRTATFSVGPCTTRSSNNPDMTTRASCPPIEASASSATAFPGLRVRFQSPQISGRAGLCLFVT